MPTRKGKGAQESLARYSMRQTQIRAVMGSWDGERNIFSVAVEDLKVSSKSVGVTVEQLFLTPTDVGEPEFQNGGGKADFRFSQGY